jgi:flagellar biosynthesis/type III secretory pathway protein FliH
VTFHLIHADDATLLSSERAIIKRGDRAEIFAAADALRSARDIRAKAKADSEMLREQARAEGLAEADTTVRAMMTEAIGELAETVDQHLAARRREIAEAAYAATRAIIGELDDTELVQRLVDRALKQIDGKAPLTIEVAAALRDAVAVHLAGNDHVQVVAGQGFHLTDCRIMSGKGIIVASLSVQIEALAARWGIAA